MHLALKLLQLMLYCSKLCVPDDDLLTKPTANFSNPTRSKTWRVCSLPPAMPPQLVCPNLLGQFRPLPHIPHLGTLGNHAGHPAVASVPRNVPSLRSIPELHDEKAASCSPGITCNRPERTIPVLLCFIILLPYPTFGSFQHAYRNSSMASGPNRK